MDFLKQAFNGFFEFSGSGQKLIHIHIDEENQYMDYSNLGMLVLVKVIFAE